MNKLRDGGLTIDSTSNLPHITRAGDLIAQIGLFLSIKLFVRESWRAYPLNRVVL